MKLNFTDFNFSKLADGLLPVIVQDSATLKVLMLGYMNREAFDMTVQTGKVTFFSRERRALWTKGETSGNFLELVDMFPDCDSDALLVMAHPLGPTCHRGSVSCFDTEDSQGFIRSLEKLVSRRYSEMPEDSYTTRLFIKGVKKIAQKVGEEAVETVVEAVDGNRSRFIYEAGDLIYHLLVLMRSMDVSLSDLESELWLRHK